jgi:hypothetical protein
LYDNWISTPSSFRGLAFPRPQEQVTEKFAMPRRATLTYSSEDAPELHSDQLYVYYCKYSGKHALTTDCNLAKAPRRRTDGASVIDTQLYKVKMYTTDGGVKCIKRRSGNIERQLRQNIGVLPIAYRWAVTSYWCLGKQTRASILPEARRAFAFTQLS